MFDIDHHLWTLSKPGSNGLSCEADGLFLGKTALLGRSEGRFAPRPRPELERLFTRGFGIAVQLDRLMLGLVTVAAALNANDLRRARIAAVQLRIPNLPDEFARLDMQLEDIDLKLDRVTKTTGAGDWNPAGRDWDPDKHPRTGTAPNPGWFAPTDGGGDSNADNSDNTLRPTLVSDKPSEDGRLHLPPGERNDEIGDLLEWIANAKPEDAQAIEGEINRIFYQQGDFNDGAMFQHALSEVLRNPDQATRQSVLDAYEPLTHRDPSDIGEINSWLEGATLGHMPALRSPSASPGGQAGEIAAPSAEATTEGVSPAAEAAPSDVWNLGWVARGRQIERAIKATLPDGLNLADNFLVIDHATEDVVTSIKSIDLNAATYQQPAILANRIDQHVGDLAEFTTKKWGNATVTVTENTQKQLIIAVPKGSISAAQQEVIDSAITRAQNRVRIRIVPF